MTQGKPGIRGGFLRRFKAHWAHRSLWNRAVGLQAAGALAEAEPLYRELLAADPDDVQVLTALGTLCLQRGASEEGLQYLAASLARNPRQAQALFNQGLALQRAGRLTEALASLDQGLTLSPSAAELHNTRGVVLNQLGRIPDSLAAFDAAIGLKQDFAEAHNNRGNVLAALERFSEAVLSYDRALALRPAYPEAHNNRGNALLAQEQWVPALESIDRALAFQPDYADAYFSRGNALRGSRRWQEALESYNQALGLDPNHAAVYLNRGTLLRDMNRYEEALASYDRALVLNPSHAGGHANRGNLFRDMGRQDEAFIQYAQALTLKADYPEARFNQALLRLLRGEYTEGWALYESRWEKLDLRPLVRKFEVPRWSGTQSLAGKRILLHAEQGIGDALQFCRYVPRVAALGAQVVLEVPASLVTLMGSLAGAPQVLARGSALPDFDFECPLLSLPLAFATTLTSIPAEIPYLTADPLRVQAWQAALGPASKPRIGLVWMGNRSNTEDHNRSMPLARLLPVLELPHEFHCLQTEISASDRELLTSTGVGCHANELTDFADTAALIRTLDLVISVDTAVAHLAGALGKPVWILLPYAADFRWLTQRSDSPWYPGATRLFRQARPGDWTGVIDTVVVQARAL